MARPRRRLTVIAALDVVGYSGHIQNDEIGTLRDMRAGYRTLIRPTIGRYGGNIIKTMGDGGLFEFPSVLDAVEWTIGFQNAMAERNRTAARVIEVRAAIVLADVILTDDDRFGAAVGFAMRLQTAAPPGGIAITHSVRWQLLGDLAAAFRPAGILTLRSIPYPFEAWFWVPEGRSLPNFKPTLIQSLMPGAVAYDPRSEPPEAELRPLAVVLPFDNLSGDPALDSVTDGVVEEATATLSRVRGIRVIARNSAFTYKGKAIDVRALVRDLGVRYVIEGSVRKSGEQLRVTSQLIDAETGAHLWSGRTDGLVSQTFALQDDVATQIAGALHPAIRKVEIERARAKTADAVRTHDLVLRAMPHFWAHRRDDNAAALRLLDEALLAAPRSATALSLKAWCFAQQVAYLWSEDPERDKAAAVDLAERAAELGEPDPLVYTAISATLAILFADQSRALVFAERAIALDSTFAWAWTRLGYSQAYSGRPQDGISSLERAIQLSPDDPILFNAYAGLATCHFLLHDFKAAARLAEKAIAGRPGMVWAYRLLAASAALAGELATARKAVGRLLAEMPELTIGKVQSGVHNLTGADLERYVEGLRIAGLPEGYLVQAERP